MSSAPKETGEEKKRTCSKCNKVTWHTYYKSKWTWEFFDGKWTCNSCGKETKI